MLSWLIIIFSVKSGDQFAEHVLKNFSIFFINFNFALLIEAFLQYYDSVDHLVAYLLICSFLRASFVVRVDVYDQLPAFFGHAYWLLLGLLLLRDLDEFLVS